MPHGLTYPFGEPLHQSHLPLPITSSHKAARMCIYPIIVPGRFAMSCAIKPSIRVVNGRWSRERPRRKSVIFIVAHIEQQTRHTAGTVSNRPHKSITDSRIPNSQRPLSIRVLHIMFYILCATLYSLKCSVLQKLRREERISVFEQVISMFAVWVFNPASMALCSAQPKNS